MAATSRYESPFAPLQISSEDASYIEQLALAIVQDHLAQYEWYLGPGRRHVDERVWKFRRQRGDVRAYASRRRHAHKARGRHRHRHRRRHGLEMTDALAVVSPRLSASADRFASTPAPAADLPVIHVVGSIEGTLDDVIYGILNPTIGSMRLKAEYIGVTLRHMAVLETLVAPTAEHPFESLTIKWVENVQKAVLRPAVNSRDFVYIEATGTTLTAAGERVGFHLLHSVHFPQTPALASYVRGNMSACGLYRQLPGPSGRVDVYFKGTLDPGGVAARPLVVIAAVDVFIQIWRYIECSRLKKLAWLMRAKARDGASGSGYASSSGSVSSVGLGGSHAEQRKRRSLSTQCVVCGKSPALALLTELRRRRCSLCFAYICSTCRVKKWLSHLPSAEGRLLRREFAFCPTCFRDAVHADALRVAQDECAALDGPAFGSELFLCSDSSESSRFSTNSLADSLFS
ncbi:hypothetical protein PybrP1_012222 [[Pythium] brassicae (nom. inval.)]|nr:hypothetical protein PybrP1_012222 [[Pythium] brassicae (nom. inval.)]